MNCVGKVEVEYWADKAEPMEDIMPDEVHSIIEEQISRIRRNFELS